MTNKETIRVLQVVDALGMGGAETWLMEVLRVWSKNHAGRMDFLITSGRRGIFDKEAQQFGARMHYVPYRRTHLPQFAKEFRRLLREGQYDAIHDHQDYASGWHFLMGRSLLPRVRVTHVHNPAYQIQNNYGVTLSRRLTARIGRSLVTRYATHITGTSRQVMTEYGFDASCKIPQSPLYCGFDTARFVGDPVAAKASVCREFGWPLSAKIILFAGRMDRSADLGDPQNHKNSGFAVSVGIECARQDQHARMLLAGKPTDPAISILKQRIERAGCTGFIKFVGVRRDIERLMVASDALLFPSRGEGLGMVAVEAQAAGLPVLASTAVPRECVVVPQLVRFQHLDTGASRWAADLLELAAQPRSIPRANQRVAASPFAIENSANALLRLYGEGALT